MLSARAFTHAHAKKPAKLLLFFDMAKLFCIFLQKSAFFMIIYQRKRKMTYANLYAIFLYFYHFRDFLTTSTSFC